MIEVKALVKLFGETRALDDLSFTVHEGSAFGLLGRNGAGKTTCIRIIMDIFRPDGGQVLIDGTPADKARVKVGYLPEERGLYQKRTIAEQMVYIGRLRGLSQVEATKSMYDRLEELEATEYLKRKLDTLSKGNQQKIQLAIALINNPDIIILDEPFSGLDPVNAMLLKNIVRAQVKAGKTVIFSSHQMAQVEEFCDDICLINKGKSVLEGNLDRIKRTYPRDTIVLSFDETLDAGILHGIPARIREKLGAMTEIEQKDGNSWIVKLPSEKERGTLLRVLDEIGAAPDMFAVKAPTLEEIFIEKAGNEPETESEKDNIAPAAKRGLFGRRRNS
jgi:ABC-2 type transport system ATP-binding protein